MGEYKEMIIGIDPGLKGAIAFYEPKLNYLSITDMPLMRNSTDTKFVINGKDLFTVLKIMMNNENRKIDCAIIEHPNAMPEDGPVQAFRFGYGCGIVNGVCYGLDIPIFNVNPGVWKTYLSLSQSKIDSLNMAKKIFGEKHEHYFKRKMDDGRAEAALLAYFGAKYGIK